MLVNPAFRAGGTIQTSRFVKVDSTAGKDFQAVQSANGAAIAATSTNYAGAISLETAAKSTSTVTNLVRVQVVGYKL